MLDIKDVNVIWIHAATQSSLSFKYLRSKTNFAKEIMINYSSKNYFKDNLKAIVDQIQNTGPCFVVGHSLGGLYALHLTQYTKVIGGVSISTPFRGSNSATKAKYIVTSYPLFKDIERTSDTIKQANEIKLNIPWTQVVTTAGSVPYHSGPNDGVCTLVSMTHRTDMELIKIPHTHYEILLSDDAADIISSCYSHALKEVNNIC